ncbi:MAG: hypothetical protein IPL61_25200 [Myxococcales bacterium]|nr:hypothetical protein [Myxococcales bacterium]
MRFAIADDLAPPGRARRGVWLAAALTAGLAAAVLGVRRSDERPRIELDTLAATDCSGWGRAERIDPTAMAPSTRALFDDLLTGRRDALLARFDRGRATAARAFDDVQGFGRFERFTSVARARTRYTAFVAFERGEADVTTWYACDGRPRLTLGHFTPWSAPSRAYGGAVAPAAAWMIAQGRMAPEGAVRATPLVLWSADARQPVADGTTLIVPVLVDDQVRIARVLVRATLDGRAWRFEPLEATRFPTWLGAAARPF